MLGFRPNLPSVFKPVQELPDTITDSSVFGMVDELYWRTESWSQEIYIGLHIVEFFVGC